MRHLVWCGMVLFFGVGTVWAQQLPNVTIAVTDPSGAAVPKADVRIVVSGEMKPSREGAVQAGEARFSLAQGSYDVFVDAPRCMLVRKHVDIRDSGAVRVALMLEPGQVCDPVEPAWSFPVVSEPLTEMIPEVPVSSPVLQGRSFRGKKRGKSASTSQPS